PVTLRCPPPGGPRARHPEVPAVRRASKGDDQTSGSSFEASASRSHLRMTGVLPPIVERRRHTDKTGRAWMRGTGPRMTNAVERRVEANTWERKPLHAVMAGPDPAQPLRCHCRAHRQHHTVIPGRP